MTEKNAPTGADGGHKSKLVEGLKPSNYCLNSNTEPSDKSSFFCAVYETHNHKIPMGYLGSDGLADLVQNPLDTAKSETPLVLPTDAKNKTKSVIQTRDRMTLCWVDIDHGNKSLDELTEIAQRLSVATIIYSTASATQTDCRWRVLLRISDAVSCVRFLSLQEAVRRLFGGGSEAVRIQQGFYLPTKPTPDSFYKYKIIDGLPLNPQSPPSELQTTLDQIETEYAEQERIASMAPRFDSTERASAGGIIQMVQDDYPLESVLSQFGFEQIGKKWLPPESESGSPGVHVFTCSDGIERFYVHNSSSPFCDKHLHDVFDLFVHYQFGGDVSRAVVTFAEELDAEGQRDRQREYAKERDAGRNHEYYDSKTLFRSYGDLIKQDSPLSWILFKWLEAQSTALLFGAPGSLKTFLALSISFCVAAGQEWFSNPVRRPGAVFYLCGEGHSGISARLQALHKEYQPAGELPLYVSGRAVDFTDQKAVEMTVQAIEELSRFSAEPVLIVIDTLNRAFGGGDENSSADMGNFISTIDRELKARYDAAILIVHHSGLSNTDRARGSSALKGAIDTEFRLDVEGDLRRLVCTKMKNDKIPAAMTFKAKPIDLGYAEDEETLTTAKSLVLERVDDSGVTPKLTKLSAVQKQVFSALEVCLFETANEKIHIDDWRRISLSGSLSDSSDTESKKRAFRRARTDLIKKGYVITAEDYYWISEAGQPDNTRTTAGQSAAAPRTDTDTPP